MKLLRKIKKRLNPSWWLEGLRATILTSTANSELRLLKRYHAGEPVDFTTIQHQKLFEILNFAKAHCPYYKNLFHKLEIDIHNINDLSKIPLLDKNIIRENYKQIVANNIASIRHYTMNTGGSTGEPLEFPVSCHADSPHQEFLYEIIGYKEGDIIVAFDGVAVPNDKLMNNIYWIETSKTDLPYGRRSYSSLYLNRETVGYYMNSIFELKPSILRGYPSFLSYLASYLLERKLVVTFPIKGVELTAEATTGEQIELIKQAFHTEVYFQYGHSEVSVFGYTVDSTYEYYCSPFYGLTEVLNSRGEHVAPGDIGEVVVTGFSNRALPFIRYKTGDSAMYGGNDKGVVRLKEILGRTQDYIFSSSKQKISLTALVFGCHYHAFQNIEKWQIVQDIPGTVDIHIVRGVNFSNMDEEEIRNSFSKNCDISTNFVYVDTVSMTPRGKSKFLVQNIRN